MSKPNDKDIAASMGRRRPRDAVQESVADSILGEMVPTSTIDIELEALYVSKYQVRAEPTRDELDTLKASLQASGLISPIVIRPIAHPAKDLQVKSLLGLAIPEDDLQGKFFEIVTGHNRVQAAAELGWAVIPAVIKHMTDAQAAIALTADNAIKRDLTDYDRYLSIKMLEDTQACRTGREIATTLGISTAQVTQLRSFEMLPAKALAMVSANRAAVGYKLAYELQSSGLNQANAELVTEAIQRLVTGKIRAQSQVLPWLNQQLTARKPSSYRRELRIQHPGVQPIRVVVTEGGATIDAKGLVPERLAQLIEANLESLLA